MKLLFVTPELPHTYGGGVRMLFQIKYLKQKGIDIDLLSFGTEKVEDERVSSVEKYVNKIFLLKSTQQNLVSKLKNCLLLRSYDVNFKIFFEINKILSVNKYDLIHIHKFQIAEYFVNVTSIPVVVDLWACGLNGVYSEFMYEPNLFKKAVILTRLFRFWLSDKRYYKIFKYFFVVSNEAKSWMLKRYPDKLVFVIPNGVELEEAATRKFVERDRANLIFVGDMSFFQNVDTVVFFAKNIFPLIKREVQNVKFYIVGRNPDKRVLKLTRDSSIIVTGFVENIKEYYEKADVFVAPIRTGSGIRNKIMEAMFHGVPVVATRRAVEGIKVSNYVNIVLADNKKNFANEVIKLLKNPQLRQQIGTKARQLIISEYNCNKIVEEMIQSYNEILIDHNFKQKAKCS